MRLYELRQKEVINEEDCRVLGYVADIEFDPMCGKILALIVPGPCKWWGILGRELEYVIPFRCVRQIGADIILVCVRVEDVLVKCKY